MFFEANLGGGGEQYPEPSIQVIQTKAATTLTVDLGTLEVGTYHLKMVRYHWGSSSVIVPKYEISASTGCTLTRLDNVGLFEVVVSTKGAVTVTVPNTGSGSTLGSSYVETVLWKVA